MTGIELQTFSDTLGRHGIALARSPLEILQVNTGKLCNQACLHCHVEAGPKRTELMDRKTVDRLLELLAAAPGVHTVDITGGAPELNSHFRHLVIGARSLGRKVIDRCNLRSSSSPGRRTPRDSLPSRASTSSHRFPAIRRRMSTSSAVAAPSTRASAGCSCSTGWGMGRETPPSCWISSTTRSVLPCPGRRGVLNGTTSISLARPTACDSTGCTRSPTCRSSAFLNDLERAGRLEEYMALLVEQFHPHAALGGMCRSLLSVGWDGVLYDCDFNQMLDLGQGGRLRTIWEIESLQELETVPIATGDHCYGCTAGAGSSCAGTIA